MQHHLGCPYANMPAVSTPECSFRFGAGDRVECSENGKWVTGTICALKYRQRGFPRGKCAPYQIKLDGETPGLIFATSDSDSCIRASASPQPQSPRFGEPPGDIHPGLGDALRAHKYVDLVTLEQSGCGEAVLVGEPAQITHWLGQRGWDGPLLYLDSAQMELVASWCGLSTIADSSEGCDTVLQAMCAAPKALSQLCQFIAHTPVLEDSRNHDESWHPEFQYAGDHRDPNGSDETLPLPPVQTNSPCYGHVMCAMLNLTVGASSEYIRPGMAAASRAMARSPHFPACIRRLVDLASLEATSAQKPPPPASLACLEQMAVHALGALCKVQPRARWLLRSIDCALDETAASRLRRVLVSVAEDIPPGETAGEGSATACAAAAIRTLDGLDGSISSAGMEAWSTESANMVNEAFEVLAAESVRSGRMVERRLASITDEIAAVTTGDERNSAKLWFLDAVLLPTGTAVKVRGISSKPELNGCAAVVAAPHRTGGGGLRFPVRLLSGSEAGTSMLLRPANLTVLSLKVAKAVASAALAAEGASSSK